MTFNQIIFGYLAGLSLGIYCLGLCLPIFLPILLSQKRTTKNSLFILLEFSGGRLLGYFLFGLIIGLIGELIKSSFIHYLVALVNMWTGLLMIMYSLGKIDKKFCVAIPFTRIKWPFLLGFLTGVNVCPPFIASLTYVFNLQNLLASIIYFLMFFLGTTTYLVPTAFLGLLTRFKWIAKIAQVSGVIVGLYFILQNLIRI